MSLRFLCVHQGGELYGSDRSFLQAVRALREGWPEAHIRVVLAVDGPLRAGLAAVADEAIVRDLAILRLSAPVATGLKLTLGLPYYVARAVREMARADLVYINTTVVADHILAARFFPGRAVIHAREIPKARAMPIVRALCRSSGAAIVFNSAATRRAFDVPEAQRQAVVHNGVEAIAGAAVPVLPVAFSRGRPLRVAMLGRINDWKGQDLLIDAVAALPVAARARLAVRIVGSAYRDVAEPIRALEARIAAAGLAGTVALEPFRDDPGEVYRWADVCVVPSRLPEPFGRVAIEAMAHGRPVIAAAHGGLTEIVEDGAGWLVAPNDVAALAAALAQAIDAPAVVAARAAGALARCAEHFSAARMGERLRAVLRRWLPRLSA